MQKKNFASVFLSEILIFEIEKYCVFDYICLLIMAKQSGFLPQSAKPKAASYALAHANFIASENMKRYSRVQDLCPAFA